LLGRASDARHALVQLVQFTLRAAEDGSYKITSNDPVTCVGGRNIQAITRLDFPDLYHNEII